MIEIKPCPFCDEFPKIEGSGDDARYTHSCSMVEYFSFYEGEKERELLWNNRPTEEALHYKLSRIKERLLSAKEYIAATACNQPCDCYGVCLKCSTEGDILIALMEYRGEETK